jgi:hypothetical protein
LLGKNKELPTVLNASTALVAATPDSNHGPDYKDQCRTDPNEPRHGHRAGPVVLADAVWIDKTEKEYEEEVA